MNTRNNQRARITRNKIKDVFVDLLTTKAIQSITVQDICKRIEINRSTFYTHYDDVYDLMTQIEMEKWAEIKGLFEEAEDGRSLDSSELIRQQLERNGQESLTQQNLEKLFLFLKENATFYRIYLNNFNMNQINTRIFSMWDLDFRNSAEGTELRSEIEVGYRFEYLKSGMIGVVRTWLNSGCEEAPRKMAAILKDSLGE